MKQVKAGPGDFGPPEGRNDADDEDLANAVWDKLMDDPPDDIKKDMVYLWLQKHGDDTNLLVKIAYGETQ